VRWGGRRVRALQLLGQDRALLAALSRGEFVAQEFRNRHRQEILFTGPASSRPEARRRSARVSRQIRLLRAHGLVQKVPKTHRYLVTESGRKVLTALLTALRSTVQQLTPAA
jgi:hypothetical protein